MAALGRIEIYVVDPTTGLPVNGATVEVRKQGATVSGITDPQTYSINNPGGVVQASESLTVYQPGGAVRDANVRGVSTVTATQIVVAAPGFAGVVDDDRLSPTTNLPTLYEDAEGAESKPNPMSTDSNGFVYAWVESNFYDIVVTKPGVLTERLLIDQYAIGDGDVASNAYPTGTQIFRRLNTKRTAVSGDVLLRLANAGTTKLDIQYDGKINSTAGATFAGLVTVSSGGLTVSAGSVSVPAGSIISAALASEAVTRAPVTKNGVGAFTITGTPTSILSGGAFSYTPTSGNVGVLFIVAAYINCTSAAALGTYINHGLTIGGVEKANCTTTFDAITGYTTERIVHFEPAMAASPTNIDVLATKTGASGTIQHQPGSYANLIVIEFKK